jgi:hypothetical protein
MADVRQDEPRRTASGLVLIDREASRTLSNGCTSPVVVIG